MDIMVILQIIVLLGAIFVGVRLGGIAVSYTHLTLPTTSRV